MRSRRHRHHRPTPTFVEALETRRLLTATLASVNPAGIGAGDAQSIDPTISTDGRFVVFASNGADLVPGFADSNGAGTDVFLRDRQTGTTTLISHDSDVATAGGNAASKNPVISGNGQFVAFESDAIDLGSGAGGAGSDVYLYD